MTTLIAPYINFFVLIGILIYFLRGPMKNYARDRSSTIDVELKEVKEIVFQAQERYKEYSKKLENIETQIEALSTEMLRAAEEQKKKIITNAESVAKNIIQDANASAEQMIADIKSELTKDLGFLVVERAERLVKDKLTQPTAKDKFAKQFFTEMSVSK